MKTFLLAAGLFVLTVVLGAVFIPYAGVQFDESLFVEAIYSTFRVEHAMKFGEFRLPIMLLTYMGTIKAGIYAVLLRVFDASIWTLRLPPLLWAAASVTLFFATMRRLCGTKPAVLAALLLATDAMYLLTSVFDWGPVALQHLLTTLALYAGVRYAQEQKPWLAGLAALACGLALWDKAIFVWLLVGGAVALTVVFPREIVAASKNRRFAWMIVGLFVLGALPFLYYNKIHPLRTITANIEEDAQPRLIKVQMLDKTLDGGGLFGYLVQHNPEGFPQGLQWVEKIPLFASGKLRAPQMSWQHLLLAAAFFGAPFLWRTQWRKPAMFAFVTFGISWLLMIYSRATGGGAHHTILLWPLPQWLLALGLAAVGAHLGRRAFQFAALLTVLCVGSNLALLNQYLAQFVSSGPTWIWTDAIYPLHQSVNRRIDRSYCSVDWGIANQLRYLTKGKVQFVGREDGITLDFDTPRRDQILARLLWDPKATFILRTEGREVFGGSRERFFQYVKDHGYQGEIVETLRDRHGSPVFELWEFHR